jgi:hypothetical protein
MPPAETERSWYWREADFSSDIIVRFKASERGAAAVINPRYVVKNTG